MASSVQHIDNEERSLDTLITILARLRARSFSLIHNAIPIAHALLDVGYDRNGMSNDLWTQLTNTYGKRAQLSQFLSPIGGTLSRVYEYERFYPKNTSNLGRHRDGRFSVVGGIMDDAGPMPTAPPANGMTTLQLSYSFKLMLSKFAGQDMENLLTGQGINDPSNALLLNPDSHQAFDKFKFGVECQSDRYFLRMLVQRWSLPPTFSRHFEGEELLFGQGPEQVALPSARLCNIQLAVGRVLRASGAADAIDKILEDEEDLSYGTWKHKRGVVISHTSLVYIVTHATLADFANGAPALGG
ncbi:hypothetical protein V1508DRAFT_445071 [Lipomyces doorenjongii]|uniref:uncharacterized protein n=1 Tax=Lipomyces doorenjongii TaxID=383834 RepID=UPI0034CE2067